MRKTRIGVLFTISTLVVLRARTASAGPSAALLVGDGFKDGYNLGLGVRGGYTLPMNVYLGGTFVYHLGKSEPTQSGDAKLSLFYLGAEGGYEINAGPLIVRPFLGLGYANVMATVPGYCVGSVCAAPTSLSDGRVGIWPGATALFPVGNLFFGADLRYVVLVNTEDSNAISFFVTGGTTF